MTSRIVKTKQNPIKFTGERPARIETFGYEGGGLRRGDGGVRTDKQFKVFQLIAKGRYVTGKRVSATV
ncbi:MAG: hypothetical protein NZT92_12820 [Abditibacteriales bacterium]|nr:hypothetical protein [Abditibacteriales bacterium]MDW8366882.1 hypothetical protein [Abditibacteriales bacterium]